MTTTMTLLQVGVTVLTLGTVVGCAGIPYRKLGAPDVSSGITQRGEPIYQGRVFPLRADRAGAVPTYIYERRVDDQGGQLVSTHVTRYPNGAIALAESALHDADYRLSEYTLHANQLGQTGSVRVDGDKVSFHVASAAGHRYKVERTRGPVVTGPTLVGFIVRHLDELRTDKSIGVRMAILDRLETIGFTLQQVSSQPGQTQVRMRASALLMRLFIDPVYFTFDSATGKLLHLEGRVPPKVRGGDEWKDFDARVEYSYFAKAYR